MTIQGKETTVKETLDELLSMVTSNIKPNMTKNEYQMVLKVFNYCHGFMTKCKNEDDQIIGYLIRIENPYNPNEVFINYKALPERMCNENTNFIFEKSIAILQTIRKGIRYIKQSKKDKILYKDFSFKNFIVKCKKVSCFQTPFFTEIGSLYDIIKKNFDPFSEIQDEWYVGNNGLIINKYIFDYMENFESKAKKYYKNNIKEKEIITLPL